MCVDFKLISISTMLRHLDIVQNAITVSEERELIKYFNKLLARKKYEGNLNRALT